MIRRVRQCLALTHSRPLASSCLCSAEIDQKLQEIMKQTGYLKIDGQVIDADFLVGGVSGRVTDEDTLSNSIQFFNSILFIKR